MNDFGKQLRYYREKQGLTLREMARRCGYSYSYLANIEAGRKIPRLFTMDCLMKTLSVNAGYVVQEVREDSAS
ncbi:MAG TPA: helix-turn-helix transcriptional regulator [Oligoflexus sp.]|uniref:helix-turn-helix domain-containing protein n=1 Tax=Oligoflexus sp. TaxID=1971216 RepID=UPI002D4AA652|nr:helix-turn-helix transcriptional regulator [Oligoflexus sp.]HYX36836.1 helix-turn-helix transcriptional regulator [Oligoflexus sp.]